MFLLLVGDDIKLRQIASSTSTSVPMTQKHLANVTSHRTTFCHLYYLTCQDDILQTAIEHKNCRGRGGGQVVTFYSDDLSSNPTKAYSFSVEFSLKRTKINKKRPRLSPLLKNTRTVSIKVGNDRQYLGTTPC